jgi:hypothetical protein
MAFEMASDAKLAHDTASRAAAKVNALGKGFDLTDKNAGEKLRTVATGERDAAGPFPSAAPPLHQRSLSRFRDGLVER